MSGSSSPRLPERDRPWMMRTYAGHSTAKASTEQYRRNLEKGQTGLSIAFDLPTQTGYDPDDELARGEVGKVGVPIPHRGDMAALMDGIPLGEMNTSMTINATAAWLLALYIVTAEEQGVAQEELQGTTQNDIIKEFLARERYGISDERLLRFRYGVQVNSLGLTEAQPENNVQRIVLEALAVTLGRDARARAIQLPAWNEALGLPRPWDQQWSLRIQQVLAYETDILEYPDIFAGSTVMEGLVAELLEGARAEIAIVAEHGGAVKAVDYMKAALVDSHRERIRRIESGEQVVVGQNRFTESEASPLTDDAQGGILLVEEAVEAEQIEAVRRWRAERDQQAVDAALRELAAIAREERLGENLMVATIAAARAGATTGEWAGTLREVFGSYRAPTGVGEAAALGSSEEVDELREQVSRL